jgi:hypothetical protein
LKPSLLIRGSGKQARASPKSQLYLNCGSKEEKIKGKQKFEHPAMDDVNGFGHQDLREE